MAQVPACTYLHLGAPVSPPPLQAVEDFGQRNRRLGHRFCDAVVRPPERATKPGTEEHSHLGTTDGSQDRAPDQAVLAALLVDP